jgi:hypothetical protein
MADAMELSKQVFDICSHYEDPSTELRAFLDAHPQVSVTQYRGARGTPALHRALERGHAACVRMLLAHGADVHAVDDFGQTALTMSSHYAPVECMQILIDAKADVNASSNGGWTAAHFASIYDRPNRLQLLIDNRADVNASTNDGRTVMMFALEGGDHLLCLQLLLDNKADLNARDDDNRDALYYAMQHTDRPELAFVVLCCNTDAKNVSIDVIDEDEDEDENGYRFVTATKVTGCIEEYKHIQAYIDEYHHTVNLVLSEHVPVDPRFGLGQMGIYQEPLERTLEYLGLSMARDQVVNASIDGEGITRALIPDHMLSAKHWYERSYKRRRGREIQRQIQALQTEIDGRNAEIHGLNAEFHALNAD